MAELGLNVFQVFQNELQNRESGRSTLGLSIRLHILETKLQNAEAVARNGRVWKLHHSLAPIKALTPDSRRAAKRREEKVIKRSGGKPGEVRDPTKVTRDEEVWEVAQWFPRTVLEFKELAINPWKVWELMEYYQVPAYTPDHRLIEVDAEDEDRDIGANIETCMEELAMSWGINWQRIDGLTIPVPHGMQFTPSSLGKQRPPEFTDHAHRP